MELNKLSKSKMLIADDIELNRVILHEIFAGEYNVVDAVDGQQAIDILEIDYEEIAIVILDIVMPNKSGHDVLAKMKEDERLREIPVVVVTQINDVENEIKALDMGADDLIVKPYDPRVIKQRVKNIIGKREVEHIRTENRLLQLKQLEEERYKIIVEQSGTIIFEWDNNQNTLYLSEDFKKLKAWEQTQTNQNSVISYESMKYVFPEDREIVKREFADKYSMDQKHAEALVRMQLIDDSFAWCKLSATRIEGSSGKGGQVLGTINIVDSEVKAELELRRHAEYDDLTGIYNRNKFYTATEQMIAQNSQKDYVLIRFDIERFKAVNDTFGIREGDKLLKLIAQKLGALLKNAGTYGRLEADNFVMCFSPSQRSVADIIASLDSFAKKYKRDYSVVFCFGSYEIRTRNMPVNTMCDRAKLALQSVKGNYLKRHAVYDDTLRRRMMEEQEIINDMNVALSENQFEIYLQPVYSLSTGKPISAEALVRWRHPKKGMLSPGVFVPIFEHNGFITKLDSYVWECACKWQRKWIDEGLTPLPISVNMSRVNIYKLDLCEELTGLIKKYNITTSLLEIEITETAYTENPTQLLNAVTRLRECGFFVLMDDFGSGYSSLNMLKDIPVDILKIDMQFLSDFEETPRAASILTSIVRMARWLGMPVIAEGVERATQVDYLRSVGCDKIQGYYFSKPLCLKDYEKLLTMDKVEITDNEDILAYDQVDINQLWSGNTATTLLFKNIIGGMGIYELIGDSLEIVRVNDDYYKLMGQSPSSFAGGQANVLLRLSENARQKVLEACKCAIDSLKVETTETLLHRLDGKMINVLTKIRYLFGNKNRALLYISLEEIPIENTKQWKDDCKGLENARRCLS